MHFQVTLKQADNTENKSSLSQFFNHLNVYRGADLKSNNESYTLESKPDGTITMTWDSEDYVKFNRDNVMSCAQISGLEVLDISILASCV